MMFTLPDQTCKVSEPATYLAKALREGAQFALQVHDDMLTWHSICVPGQFANLPCGCK